MPTTAVNRRVDVRRIADGNCEHPKCHEHLKVCMGKMVTKRTMWAALIVLGLPLLVTGVKVWSQQESDHLRYADRESLIEHSERLTKQEMAVKHMADDIKDIQINQQEARKDIKEILRYMRNDGSNLRRTD